MKRKFESYNYEEENMKNSFKFIEYRDGAYIIFKAIFVYSQDGNVKYPPYFDPLDGVELYAQISPYCEKEYPNVLQKSVSSTDYKTALEIVKSLGKIQKQLDKLYDKLGPAERFWEVLGRLCYILDVETIFIDDKEIPVGTALQIIKGRIESWFENRNGG